MWNSNVDADRRRQTRGVGQGARRRGVERNRSPFGQRLRRRAAKGGASNVDALPRQLLRGNQRDRPLTEKSAELEELIERYPLPAGWDVRDVLEETTTIETVPI